MKPPQPYATVVANGSCQLMKRAAVHSSQAFRDVAGVETTTNQPHRLSEIGALKGVAGSYWRRQVLLDSLVDRATAFIQC
jgi:hypothetical protein